MTPFFRTYVICLNVLWTEYQVDNKHNEKATEVKGIKNVTLMCTTYFLRTGCSNIILTLPHKHQVINYATGN